MEIELIQKVADHWKQSSVMPISRYIENQINAAIPDDFKFFYSHLNGMCDDDSEGFFFCPTEQFETMGDKFRLSKSNELFNIVMFADYLQSCWWYGYKILNDQEYQIGIIPNSEKFKLITTSLSEFLSLYLIDSEILYDFD